MSYLSRTKCNTPYVVIFTTIGDIISKILFAPYVHSELHQARIRTDIVTITIITVTARSVVRGRCIFEKFNSDFTAV